MNAPTLPISLSGLETVFLLDSMRNGATVKDVEDQLSSTKDLILELGGLYRELVSVEGIKDGPLSLAISQEQAWTLRSKVRTGDLAIDGKTNIGVPLSLKLYDLLARFDSHVEESFDDAGTDGHPFEENDREALKALRMTEEMNSHERRDKKPRPGSYRSPSS